MEPELNKEENPSRAECRFAVHCESNVGNSDDLHLVKKLFITVIWDYKT